MNKILIIVCILILIILEFNIFNLKNILEKLKKYFRLVFFFLLILVVLKYNKTKDTILPFKDIIKSTKQYKFLSNWTSKVNKIISLFTNIKFPDSDFKDSSMNYSQKNNELNFKTTEKKIPLKRNLSESKKKIVASNQHWRCLSCQNLLDATYEIDHIVPLFKNGSNDIENLQALCRNCHGKKTILDKIK